VLESFYQTRANIHLAHLNDQGTEMPRLHPILQAMAAEWESSQDVLPHWDRFSPTYIAQLCHCIALDEPTWHADLFSTDLSTYLSGIPQDQQWWVLDHEIGTLQSSLCLIINVHICMVRSGLPSGCS
jgi:hypothetical protein